MNRKIISTTLVIVGFVLGASALSAMADWAAPDTGCTPPSCNADAPINASTTSQTKKGPLYLNSLNPTTDNIGLRILGRLKMVDGNQAAGKVLTSDADGVGTWQSKYFRSYFFYDHSENNTGHIVRKIGVLEPGTYTVSGKLFTSNDGGAGWGGVFLDSSDSVTPASAHTKLTNYYGLPETSQSGAYYGINQTDVSHPDTVLILKRNGVNDGTFVVPYGSTITINQQKHVYSIAGNMTLDGVIMFHQ